MLAEASTRSSAPVLARWRGLQSMVSDLDVGGMSSDEEDGGVLAINVPAWRSQAVNDWMRYIDKRDWKIAASTGKQRGTRVYRGDRALSQRPPVRLGLAPFYYAPDHQNLADPANSFSMNAGELSTVEGLHPQDVARTI
jgi:hypothetical protein